MCLAKRSLNESEARGHVVPPTCHTGPNDQIREETLNSSEHKKTTTLCSGKENLLVCGSLGSCCGRYVQDNMTEDQLRERENGTRNQRHEYRS